MFGGGYRAQKLKTNLRLVINRLKMMEKKKTELAQKARKEIADYITVNKYDRARIRVEHIIREDYLVEAMELVELYCDLLLARFGLIESMKHCDEGLVEAVSTVLWATPRLSSDCAELNGVSEQLIYKYGKEFGQQARSNTNNTVNEKLIHKLSPDPPPKLLVERYLIEIARNYNVDFTPDPEVMMSEGIPTIDSKEFENIGGGGPGNFGFGPPPPGGSFGGGSSGGGGGGIPLPDVPNLPNVPMNQNAYPPYPSGPGGMSAPYPPPAGSYPGQQSGGSYPGQNSGPAPPSYSSIPPAGHGSSKSGPPPSAGISSLPDLPDIPSASLPSSGGPPGQNSEDIDMDDIDRRFQELKRKK